MKVFFLSTFAVFLTMSTSVPSALLSAGLEPLQKELAKLDALAQERAKLFAELFPQEALPPMEDEEQDAKPVAPKTGLHSNGLQSTGLRTGGLVTGSVQSGARNLTPESEWRKMFPKKPGQK
jgi:hypothetical protein